MNRPPHGADSPNLSAHRIIDGTCDEFESQWRQGKKPRIEEFLSAADRTVRPSMLRELILLEWELRLARHDSFGLDEYLARFPEERSVIAAAWRGVRQIPLEPSTVHLAPPRTSQRPVRPENGPATESHAPNAAIPPRYQLGKEIGRGGIGVVYRARDQILGRELAVKVLQAQHANRPELLHHFAAEAQIGSQPGQPARERRRRGKQAAPASGA
jgi:hypothetical protein